MKKASLTYSIAIVVLLISSCKKETTTNIPTPTKSVLDSDGKGIDKAIYYDKVLGA